MIRRGILHFMGVVLLFLAVVLAAGWVRSHAHEDAFYRITVDSRGLYTLPMIFSDNGRLAFIYHWAVTNSVGPVHTQRWTHAVGPHNLVYEDVRWAFYRVGPTNPTGQVRKAEFVFRYWFLLVFTLVTGLIWFRLERRYRRKHPAGHCAECGYDLRASTNGLCPECGATARLANEKKLA